MPTVPRRNPNLEATAPLAGVRVKTKIPDDAFGVPMPDVLGEVNQHVTAIVDDARRKADNIALLDADNKAARLQTDLRTNALKHRGKDALGAIGAVSEDWERGVSEITNGLSTDQQRAAFARVVGSRWESLYSTVESHAANQLEDYKRETADAALNLAEGEAVAGYDQPGLVDKKIEHVRAVVSEIGSQLGWSDDVVHAKTLEATSRIHVGVIDSMLAKEQDMGAIAYLASHRGDIQGAQLPELDRKLDVASTRVESAHRADAITATAVSEDQAYREVAKITEVRVRDAVHDRVQQFYGDKQRTLVQTRTQAFERAVVALRRSGGDINAVHPADLDALGTEYGALQSVAWNIRNPRQDRETSDESVYEDLISKSYSSDSSREEFMHLDLSKYSDKLSKPDLRHLYEIQRALQNRELNVAETERRKAAAAAAKREEAMKTLRGMGVSIPGTPTSARAVPGAPIVKAAQPDSAESVAHRLWRNLPAKLRAQRPEPK